MRAQMTIYTSIETGVTLNRFSQDMTLIDAILPSEAFGTLKGKPSRTCGRKSLNLSAEALQCLASAALISLGSSYMALMMIPCIVVMYFAQSFYLKTSRQLRFLDLEAKSPLYTHFVETLEGLATIRALGWESNFHETNLKHLDNSQRPYYLLYCVQRWLNLVTDLLMAAVATILMVLAFSLRHTTSPSSLGVALTSVLAFNHTLQGLIYSWTTLETSMGAVAGTKTFEENTPTESTSAETNTPPLSWPDRGDIEFQNITASYTYDDFKNTGPKLMISSNNAIALNNISFTMHTGLRLEFVVALGCEFLICDPYINMRYP
jgi:ABC-type multidrug transport system fused ATPase/permease subunit